MIKIKINLYIFFIFIVYANLSYSNEISLPNFGFICNNEKNSDKFEFIFSRNYNDTKDIVFRRIDGKFKYIGDYREKLNSKNSRAILNFGHTIGHAIENSNFYKGNLKHGEAISLGMIVELKISSLFNYYPEKVTDLIELLKKYKLPVNYSKYINKKTIPTLIKRIAFDKKIINKDVNFVLIGKSGGFIKKISIRDLKSILYQIN